MIDIHHHLLPGLDDGARDLDISLAMAGMAIEDGITHIVCTPHASHHFTFNPEVNAERFAALQDLIQERFGDRLTLGLGCDFHLMFENIEDAQRHPTRYTINGHRYLLVEFAPTAIYPNTANTFYQLSLSGMTPIITHPERNPILARNPEKMADWIRTGALIQITASSLTGRFGPQAEQVSHWLLEHQWVHFLATDAHNLESRPPRLRFAYDLVAEKYGVDTAERLCVLNPRAVFQGDELPPQPEPAAPDAGPAARSMHRRPGFFARIFGRS
jgi:protein-tyrosine phosphatase